MRCNRRRYTSRTWRILGRIFVHDEHVVKPLLMPEHVVGGKKGSRCRSRSGNRGRRRDGNETVVDAELQDMTVSFKDISVRVTVTTRTSFAGANLEIWVTFLNGTGNSQGFV